MKSILINKYSFFAALAIAVAGLTSCEKSYSSGDDYNVSPTLPPYVELASKVINTKEGAKMIPTIQVRTAKQEDITVNYEITGALTRTGKFILKRNTVIATDTIAIPTGIVPVGSTQAVASLKLTTVGANKYNLVIGQIKPESETAVINISK